MNGEQIEGQEMAEALAAIAAAQALTGEQDRAERNFATAFDVAQVISNEIALGVRKVEDLEVIAEQQQKEIKMLTAGLKEQASEIRKVSDQLEVSKATPQTAGNDR
jgi:hypothetical protein